MEDVLGRTIRGYEFMERIGSGGFGEVYRAYQESVDREVAVKVILPEHLEHPEFVTRFEAEARTIARLEHPHIVPLYDFWQGPEGAFLIMRYLRGGNLRDKLDTEGALNPEEVGQILEQVCAALETAHQQNVVHRDLKPENILLDERGEAYLSDFGIAKDLSADYRTKTGGMMGSLSYIAPEQALANEITPAADIYCLGILLYELLTGAHPFAGLTPIQLLQFHLNSPLPTLEEVRPGLPPEYDALIQQATNKDPARRQLSAAAFVDSFLHTGLRTITVEETGIPEFLSHELADPEVRHELFIGRQQELKRFDDYLENALSGRGQVAFVSGGAGRGKTRLVSEFARQSRQRNGHLIVAGGNSNAFSGIGDPYLPFRDIMGMLTGDIEDRWTAGQIDTDHARALWNLVPTTVNAIIAHGPDLVNVFVDGKDLALRAARAGVSGSLLNALNELTQKPAFDGKNIQQAQLFEQYASVLRELALKQPLLLLLDDLQWADGASISLLFHLGRRLENARILILGTYRGEEVALGRDNARHPLEKVLTEFRQVFGEVRVDLSKESTSEGRSFVDDLLDSEPNRLGPPFRESLFERTGGHALFTLELLRSMQERGDLELDEDGNWVEGPSLDWDRLPERVEAVIEERISRLEDELRELLTVASVEGEDFTVEVLAEVQEIKYRSLLRKLSQELEKRHHLIHERGDARAGSRILSQYRFSHQLFQRYLYNELSAGERRLLHQEVAESLEHLYEGHLDKITVQLARHYQEAGDGVRASTYFVRAGQYSKRLFANKEALGHFDQALSLIDQQDETYFDVLRERAYVLAQLFRGQEAVHAYEEVLNLARATGNQQGELDALLGLGRGNYIVAIDHPEGGAAHASQRFYNDAYELAKEMDNKRGMVLALVPTVWFEDYWPEYAPTARANAKEALELSIADGDEMLILESELAMFYTDPLAARAERGDRILTMLERIGNLERLNYLHFGLMFSSLGFGDFEMCVGYCNKGIELARRIGAPPVQYPTLKAHALIMLGRFDEAWESLQEEVADESHALGNAFKQLGTGIYYLELQHFEKAAEVLAADIEKAEQLKRAWMLSSIHSNLITCVIEGNLLDEIELSNSLEYLAGKGAHKAKVANPSAAVALGWFALINGEIQEAIDEIARAKEYAEESGRRPGMVLAQDLESQVHYQLGEYEKAIDSAAIGLSLARSMDFKPLIWRLIARRIQAFQQLGQADSVRREREKATGVITEMAASISDEVLRTIFLSSPLIESIVIPEVTRG